MKTKLSALILGLGMLATSAAAAPAPGAPPEVLVSPEVVEIGAFFQGKEIAVKAEIPRGAQAVLEVVGPKAEEHLMRKGRRGGLWMNVGEVTVTGAPSLYLAMGTDPKLLQMGTGGGASWGYAALREKIRFSGRVEPGERDLFLDQFFKLKESDEIYAVSPIAAKAAAGPGEQQTVTGRFRLPTRVKPGEYQVCLTVVQDGQTRASNCAPLRVKMVGFPALLASLAYGHGATYGILAVVIAIVTGFAMGYLFKGGGGH
jgi:hypothetical protein